MLNPDIRKRMVCHRLRMVLKVHHKVEEKLEHYHDYVPMEKSLRRPKTTKQQNNNAVFT